MKSTLVALRLTLVPKSLFRQLELNIYHLDVSAIILTVYYYATFQHMSFEDAPLYPLVLTLRSSQDEWVIEGDRR